MVLPSLFKRTRKAKRQATPISAERVGIAGGCPVCGGRTFKRQAVLWDELVAAWELSEAQRAYVDDQQGLCCLGCECNLRSMTLAAAISRTFDLNGPLARSCESDERLRRCRTLEINEAGNLTPFLSKLPRYTLAKYPEYDIHDLNISTATLDLVVHSDTLEHVHDSVRALQECRRILAPDGFLAYTVPAILERQTRTREGLADSFHGDKHTRLPEYRVQREYGADFWCEVMAAGFQEVRLHSLLYPASIALVARREASSCGASPSAL